MVGSDPRVRTDLLDVTHRARLEQPIRDAVGLPGECYASEAFARLEAERMFGRTWMCAGYAHELPEPGDAAPVRVAGYPILFTRNPLGEIHAFHNVCPHRGMPLLDTPQRGNPIIKCPYHGWAFDMEGCLRSTPHWGGYRQHRLEGFDPEQHGLKSIRCARWHDWLFVNIDGKAPPFEAYLAPFAAYFAEYDLDSLVHVHGEPFEHAANWKIISENFMESLHVPTVHGRLNDYAPFQDHYTVVDGPCFGTIIDNGVPESWSPQALPRFAGLPDNELRAKNLALFPNFKLVTGPDHACSVIEFPDGAASTRQRWDFYFVGEAGARHEKYEPSRRELIDFFIETNLEDKIAVARLQIGRSSPAYHGGVFSEIWEPTVYGFQRLLLEHMGA